MDEPGSMLLLAAASYSLYSLALILIYFLIFALCLFLRLLHWNSLQNIGVFTNYGLKKAAH